MRAGASAFNDSIRPPPSPRGYMIISATMATSRPMTAAKRAPTSQAGTTAGMTIFRTVAAGERCSMRATSYWRGCIAATPAAVLQHDRPQRGVYREDQLGRHDRPEGQEGDRHQRHGRDRAQEVDRGHRVAPQRRYEPDREAQCSTECQRDARRQQRHAQRVRDSRQRVLRSVPKPLGQRPLRPGWAGTRSRARGWISAAATR